MSNYLNQFGMGDFGGSINGINGNRLGNVDHTGAVLDTYGRRVGQIGLEGSITNAFGTKIGSISPLTKGVEFRGLRGGVGMMGNISLR